MSSMTHSVNKKRGANIYVSVIKHANICTTLALKIPY